MTYGVVITLLVLALIATVIAVTVTSNQPPAADAEAASGPEGDANSDPGAAFAAESTELDRTVLTQTADQQTFEEIAQPNERQIAGLPEEAADDSGPIRV
jgi:hypothetical protein